MWNSLKQKKHQSLYVYINIYSKKEVQKLFFSKKTFKKNTIHLSFKFTHFSHMKSLVNRWTLNKKNKWLNHKSLQRFANFIGNFNFQVFFVNYVQDNLKKKLQAPGPLLCASNFHHLHQKELTFWGPLLWSKDSNWPMKSKRSGDRSSPGFMSFK